MANSKLPRAKSRYVLFACAVAALVVGSLLFMIIYENLGVVPSLSISDSNTSNEDAQNTTFTVTLSDAYYKTITVDYASSNGTATAGADYTSSSGTLTFAAGETSKTISVSVLADTLDEDNETVILTLSNANAPVLSCFPFSALAVDRRFETRPNGTYRTANDFCMFYQEARNCSRKGPG